MKTTDCSSLKGNLKTLMATGGLLAGAGSGAQAAIVYTDISDLTISAGQNLYFSLTGQDADTTIGGVNGGPQLRLYFQSNVSTAPNLAAYNFDNNLAAVQGFNAGPYNGFFANRLSSGAVINGANLSEYGYAFLTYSIGAAYAEWSVGDRGYVGVRINSGGARFGWADVSYNANESLTLYGFAYEDSGGQILAGMTVVPELTTTGGLAVIFAGSVAAFEVRRRRKAAPQTKPNPMESSPESLDGRLT